MSVVIDATPGSPTANSYETVAEFLAYVATKPGAKPPTPGTEPALLINATRLLDTALRSPDLALAEARGQEIAFGWTGEPTTPDVQALAWPRIGMFTANGVLIDPTVIPQGVKDSVSEIALVSASGKDLTATNDVAVQGISSVKAGSVQVNFHDPVEGAALKVPPLVIPDAAYVHLVPSWYQTVVAGAAGAGTSAQWMFART
jgi:hypothetical protein